MVTVTIAAGTTAEQVSEDWERMLFKALDLCHKTDKSVCLLQPNDVEYGRRIYTTSDKPDLFQGWEDYFQHKDQDLLCKPTPKDNPRRIISTALMGFSDSP